MCVVTSVWKRDERKGERDLCVVTSVWKRNEGMGGIYVW